MAACALKDGTHTLVATPHSRNGLFHNSLAHVLVQVTQFKKILGENQILFQLSLDGITPVLAYPERNTALQRNPGILSELVSMGCLVQLTAMSITGELGRDAMEYSHFMLQ